MNVNSSHLFWFDGLRWFTSLYCGTVAVFASSRLAAKVHSAIFSQKNDMITYVNNKILIDIPREPNILKLWNLSVTDNITFVSYSYLYNFRIFGDHKLRPFLVLVSRCRVFEP